MLARRKITNFFYHFIFIMDTKISHMWNSKNSHTYEGFKIDKKSYTFFLIKRCEGLKFDPIIVVGSNLTTNCELYPRNYRELQEEVMTCSYFGDDSFQKAKATRFEWFNECLFDQISASRFLDKLQTALFLRNESDAMGEWKRQKR